MIHHITGKLAEKKAPTLVIDVNGIGYEINAPMSTFYQLPNVGDTITLLTHFVVREDAQLLYGFFTEQERKLFRALIKVNGVGPKTGLALLSAAPMNELIRAIQLEDHAVFQAVSGIGPKTAKRLVLELRSVFEDVEISIPRMPRDSIDERVFIFVEDGI